MADFDAPTDIITGEIATFKSTSYDPDGSGCSVTLAWDLNGDGLYDDGTDTQESKSWTTPGIYAIGLRAVDSCALVNTKVKTVHVHVGVTEQEDKSAKALNMSHNYVSSDLTAGVAASNGVDVTNPAGPWDFTGLPLKDVGTYSVALATDNPEVIGFASQFPSSRSTIS